MGLDMYLKKTKKVEEFSAEDYAEVSEKLPWKIEEFDGDLEKASGVKGANRLLERVRESGQSLKYLTIFEELGYWRKANQIHAWFVENVQGGTDECQLSEVSREQLEELLAMCRTVMDNGGEATEILPAREGFFFGSTDYDEYYFQDIESTIEILEKALAETDFENETVFYQASW